MKRKVLFYILLFSIIVLCSGVVFATEGMEAQVEVNNILETTFSILIGYCLISSLYLIVELIILKFDKENNFLCNLLNILIGIGGSPFFLVPLISILVKLVSKNKRTKVIVNVCLACFLLLAAFMLYMMSFSGRAHNIEVKPE